MEEGRELRQPRKMEEDRELHQPRKMEEDRELHQSEKMEEDRELHQSEKKEDTTQKWMKSGSEKYREFRIAYPEFIYHGFKVEETDRELKVEYWFEISGLEKFCPRWVFPKAEKNQGDYKKNEMEDRLFSLGLVELVSYWKLTCSPKVVIRAGKLDKEQIDWWKRLYFHGLGEFFYVNQITEARLEDFMEIVVDLPSKRFGECDQTKAGRNAHIHGGLLLEDEYTFADGGSFSEAGCKVLVPIGGGKDSVVALELLKEAKADIWGYGINPRGAMVKTASAARLSDETMLSAGRSLDKRMLELNRKGFLNGHTPFSAIVAFSSLVMAKLYGIGYIALSNESSANESTIQGSTVNHQYSKSFQFEKDFHEYTKRYLPGSAYYFSLLRPLSEFQIAGYFSACKAYHSVFRSCNVGSKEDAWCGHCPKCLFVAAILSPFLSLKELTQIWGKNLLEDESLQGILEQLTGIQEEKPFECVGSRREVNTALFLTVSRLEREGEPLPALLAYYRKTPQFKAARQLGDVFSDYFDEENLVPEPLKELVRCRCTKEEARKKVR